MTVTTSRSHATALVSGGGDDVVVGSNADSGVTY